MKNNQKYNTVGTIPKSNIEIAHISGLIQALQ
jgi:hypothetical protein